MTKSEWFAVVYVKINEKQGFSKKFILVHTTKYIDEFYLGMKCIFIIAF